MSKGHRDNYKARKKRGTVAFAKKAARRTEHKVKCSRCGTASRPTVIEGGMCPPCRVVMGVA